MEKQTKDTPLAGKSTRGGARPGAGRPKGTVRGARAQFTVVLSREERAKIDAMRGNLSMSAFIRQKLGL